jgi:hypothetical protein
MVTWEVSVYEAKCNVTFRLRWRRIARPPGTIRARIREISSRLPARTRFEFNQTVLVAKTSQGVS